MLLVPEFIEQYGMWKKSNRRREKSVIIKKNHNSRQINQIDERIIRHVVTVGKFLKNPLKRKPCSDHGDLKSVSKRYMNRLKRSAHIERLEKQVKDSLKNLGCRKKQKPQPNVSL